MKNENDIKEMMDVQPEIDKDSQMLSDDKEKAV